MVTYAKAQGVHYVGSLPYATAEETFSTLAQGLPGRLRRIPDGETGERNYWTWWLHSNFPDWALSPLSYPARMAVSRGERDPGGLHWFTHQQEAPERKPGEEMVVRPTNYARAAIESYAVFKQLKARGVIEPAVRFQVSFATSAAVVCSHVQKRYKTEADAAFEPHVLDAIREVQEAIPAEELAIQFDLAVEMGLLEKERGRSPDVWFAWFEPGTTMAEILPRIARHAAAVREPVELGFHFCYGDVGHEHWAQPLDTALIVSLFNGTRKSIGRRIDFVHLPVPVDRDDEAYFTPLTTMDLDPSTELYLGLVREEDLEGTERRLATAQRVVKRPFGVATECGLGRIDDKRLAADVLRIAHAVADPVLSA